MMQENDTGLTSDLPRKRLEELYDRALDRTKDLHADVWNGVRFFTGVQIVLLGLVGGLAQVRTVDDLRTTPLILLLIVALGANTLGVFTLYRHRQYYLDSMRVKTLLEELLGLHTAADLHGEPQSLALPWTEPPARRPQLLQDPVRWSRQSIFRWGTITSGLFLTYLGFALLDVATIVITWTGNL